jgi:hypothetical protein
MPKGVRGFVGLARQVVTGATLQEIGREFGGRYHSTALHCIRKIEKLRCSDDAVDRAITQVMYAAGVGRAGTCSTAHLTARFSPR